MRHAPLAASILAALALFAFFASAGDELGLLVLGPVFTL